MAKKYRKSELILLADSIVNYLYQVGVLHSFVVHTFLLTYLALLFPALVDNQKIKPINISFVTNSEMVELNLESFPDPSEEIEVPKNDESSDREASSTELGSYNEVMAQDTVDIKATSIEDLDFTEYSDAPTINLTPSQLLTTIESPKPQELKPASRAPRVSMVLSNATPAQNGQNQTVQLTNNISDKTYEGEISKRLVEYGAKTGDIQISLSWDTVDDLDLHVMVQPMNSRINWMHRVGRCGGILDIDMNFNPIQLTNRPIENIFWGGPVSAPNGQYTVGVHYYMSWSKRREVPAVVLIKCRNQTKSFPVVVRYGEQMRVVTSFNY